MESKDTFFYFAFGSNLLKERITFGNPTAEYIGVGHLAGYRFELPDLVPFATSDDSKRLLAGHLAGYRFEYAGFSKTWCGATANITADATAEVWGAVWKLKWADSAQLDRQEGRYRRLEGDTQGISIYSQQIQCPVCFTNTGTFCVGKQPTMAFPEDDFIHPPTDLYDPLWKTEIEARQEPVEEYFYYFGFGSNLLQERIQNKIPSAAYVGVGRLNDHRLGFGGYCPFWHGAGATLFAARGEAVYGVVWRVDSAHSKVLDEQEIGYHRLLALIHLPESNKCVRCRTYQMSDVASGDHRPSPHYKHVILCGAIEHRLPGAYLQHLATMRDNGYRGAVAYNFSVLHELNMTKALPPPPADPHGADAASECTAPYPAPPTESSEEAS